MRSTVLTLFAFLITASLMLISGSQTAHAQLRPMVYTDRVIEAPVERVWQDWTTAQGLESFLAPKAIVDARPGGAYEVWFAPDAPEGQRGAENGIVIGLQTADDGSRMINFTWAMPHYMPEIRPHMTAVQIWFVPAGKNKTRIRLFHTGFGDTEEWREGRDYFAKAWPDILNLYAAHIEAVN